MAPCRAAAHALALFGGEPIAEFRYEQFARDDVVRIEELRVGALEQRIDADLEAGRHGELVAELVNLVTAHPLREHLRAQLMVALYRCGRQNEALDTYQRGRRQLATELGIDPGPELQQLERQILAHDPSLAPTAVAAPMPRPNRPERRLVTVLVGDVVAGGAGPLDPEDHRAVVAPSSITFVRKSNGSVAACRGCSATSSSGCSVPRSPTRTMPSGPCERLWPAVTGSATRLRRGSLSPLAGRSSRPTSTPGSRWSQGTSSRRRRSCCAGHRRAGSS